jgi:hypothetical protein
MEPETWHRDMWHIATWHVKTCPPTGTTYHRVTFVTITTLEVVEIVPPRSENSGALLVLVVLDLIVRGKEGETVSTINSADTGP